MSIIGKSEDGTYGIISGSARMSEIDRQYMDGVKMIRLTKEQITALQIARTSQDIQDILEIVYNQ